VKKKNILSHQDEKDWIDFIKSTKNLTDKEGFFELRNSKINKFRKLDLHGYSLNSANKAVKEFINESFNIGCKKILIVTGKGLRSKSHKNPYFSNQLSILKNSVPEFVKNEKSLKNMISRIEKASLKDGGEGAIYIFLKNNKNLQNKF